MDCGHCQACVLPIEVDRQKALLTKQTLIDLIEARLNHLELLTRLLEFLLHFFSIIDASREIIARRWCIIELSFKEELRLQVAWLDFNLGPELDDVPENNQLLRISNEEHLGIKRISLIVNIWFNKSVETRFFTFLDLLRISRVMMVRIGIVNSFLVLVENLELQEVDALLDKVYVSEVLQMENKFSDGS